MTNRLAFWLIPIFIFALQAMFTFASLGQIRMEEVNEAIREAFWFQHGLIYAAPASNVGWYGTLVILYNLVGFDIYYAKFFRLGLQLVSLFALAALLKRYFGAKWAVVPLLTIGLSPTLLFFNTLEAPYGMDLQYLPIILFLILSYLRYLGWFLAMVAWLTYPSFVFFLPGLGIVYVREIWQIRGIGKIREIGLGLTAFLLPLVAVVLFVKDKLKLIFDPFYERGLFTSGGGFEFNFDLFFHTMGAIFENLFVSATSYYLELAQVEFSYAFPGLTFVFVLVASLVLYKRGKHKLSIGLCYLVMALTLLVVSFTIDGGGAGARRNTPFLAGIYGLFTIVWWYSGKVREVREMWGIRVILGLFLLHHLIVFPMNLVRLSEPALFQQGTWFATSESPEKSIEPLSRELSEKDLYLNCDQFTDLNVGEVCEYGHVFAALKGHCLWNHLECHRIYGMFPEGYRELELSLWDDPYFER